MGFTRPRPQTARRAARLRRITLPARHLATLLVAVVLAITYAGEESARAAPLADAPAQSDAVTILSQAQPITDWRLGGGFLYWNCVNRRAVDGFAAQTLNPNACAPHVADESGLYYFNEATNTLEALYSHAPHDTPTVLATLNLTIDTTVSHLILGDRHLYWVESEFDCFGDDVCLPVENRIRRVDKTGGAPETLHRPDPIRRVQALAVTPELIAWIDGQGLKGFPKAPCTPAPCSEATLHTRHTVEARLAGNGTTELLWAETSPAMADIRVLRTRCQGTACTTTTRYTAPPQTRIVQLVAGEEFAYWTESVTGAPNRLRRMPIASGGAQTLLEDGFGLDTLAVDPLGVYYGSVDRRQILRLSHRAQDIRREIAFRGWEVTQAIQNLGNTAPLVSGNETYVRVYPVLMSGRDSAGVEAVLHGAHNGAALPGSPLHPLHGPIPVRAGVSLSAQRAQLDGGWLFRLPESWTKRGDALIPHEDTELTLRVELDPRGLTGDTTPQDNSAQETFTFAAKAPICARLRPVWTEAPHQSPWDISVAAVFDLAGSMHPTVDFLPFPEHKRLEKTEWCRKGPLYGPFCSGPYRLSDHANRILRKLLRKQIFGSTPAVCLMNRGHSLLAAIAPQEAEWINSAGDGVGGRAFLRLNVSLNKVPRYGAWSWPMTRNTGLATVFVHEVGHNFNRRHVGCGVSTGVDGGFPYDPCTLDDRDPDLISTHFGFDTRLLTPIHPAFNRDYMAYGAPRWVSDYTWRAIFDRTRQAGPLSPLFGAQVEPATSANAHDVDVYVFASGLITSTDNTAELSAVWTYPTAEAGQELPVLWAEETASPRRDEPYYLRLVGAEGQILDERAIQLFPLQEQEEDDHDLDHDHEFGGAPFQLIFPAPAVPVREVLVMENGAVLAALQAALAPPQITLLAPSGAETVTDTVELVWRAADPGDAPWLDYTVQYSPNRGQDWFVLLTEYAGPGLGITETLPLNLGGQPGSDGQNALLRLVASNGYHTTLATSEPFTVTTRAPQVTIAAPQAGQWHAAHQPIALRGAVFDPADGFLPESAHLWVVDTQTHPARSPMIHGLAPGLYTATLTVTNTANLTAGAHAPFHIAPLTIPQAASPVLDGHCDDLAYGARRLPLSPYPNGAVAYASLARDAEHLWVCFQGLQDGAGFAGILIDTGNNRMPAPQPSDLGFFVAANGAPTGFQGNGERLAPVAPHGLATRVAGEDGLWSAELRLDVNAVGGWNRVVSLALTHYVGLEDHQRMRWPHASGLEQPQTWAETYLFDGPLPKIREIAPYTATVGSSLGITITGEGFQAATAALWNGGILTTTFVDAETLRVELEAEQTTQAGLHHLQLAPHGASLAAASQPAPFLVLYAQPALEALSPATTVMGSPGITLTVTGAGFAPGAQVLWNGEPRPTAYGGTNRLEAAISAADLADGRNVTVAVANPEPSLAVSNGVAFAVDPPPDDAPAAPPQLFVPHMQGR